MIDMKNSFVIFFFLILVVCACTGSDHHAHDSTHEVPESESSDLMLTDTQMKLANITVSKVTQKPVGRAVTVNGRLAVNEENTQTISSRADGRIERLFIKETGEPVAKGQPLYVLYSEKLLTLQQEYLLAKEQYEALGKREPRYKSFVEAAERKLLLYGLSSRQVAAISRNTLQPNVTFLSPASGIIANIDVSEGQYVSEGAVLYKVEDIGTLWIEAERYAHEKGMVEPGDHVRVTVTGAEPYSTDAPVIFVSPELTGGTQILRIRARFENPGNRFRPGQHVRVELRHATREVLAVPSDAVIRDEQGSHVYMQTASNTFRPRRVTTGVENAELVEITEGLSEGDTIAATGAYLLYAERILKNGTHHNH